MKPTFFTTLLVALALMLTGCSSTRKATQTKFEQSITESSSTTSTTHDEKSEGLLTQSNITENLNAVIDFTRIEFNDGTTLTDIRPPIIGDSAKQRDREQTEPPNTGKGIKSITTGRIDLSNHKNETTETVSTSDSKSDTSNTAVNDSSSDTKKDEQSEEKDKRGWLYYLGEIIGAITLAVVVVFLLNLIGKINWKTK